MSELVLHDYWRSSAAYRVRIALHLKRLAFTQVAVNLLAGEQRDAAYLDLNPQGLAPTLTVGALRLTQSGAIIEWIEETHPEPPLLPTDAGERAIVRAMAAIVGADIHPLNNLRVQQVLRGELAASDAAVSAWIHRWMNDGFTALEALVSEHGGRFAFGGAPTLADCFIVPQIYSADRFGVDMGPYPAIARVTANARAHPAFIAAHPDKQPDKPA